MRILFISLLIVTSMSAFAQKRGVIIDIETRVPIGDARLFLSTNKEVDTNYRGEFHIVGDFNSLSIVHPKYLTRKMTCAEMTDTIFLIPIMNELSEVVVWGKKKDISAQFALNPFDLKLASINPNSGINLLGLLGYMFKSHKKEKQQERNKEVLKNY
jgi:hypothetical protein